MSNSNLPYLPYCSLIPPSSKVLVIAEKPSVARDLAKVLGGSGQAEGYIPYTGGFISWARGHLLELAQPSKYNPLWENWRWETLPMVPDDYQFQYVVKREAAGQLSVLKKLYKEADVVINACDAGREGELIWWEILRHCGWGANKPIPELGPKLALRFWSQSNTPDGLKEAWETMRPVSDRIGLVESCYCRSESDWLLGLNATRATTLSFPVEGPNGKKGWWSVGRVQTPVLALIAARDNEISNFKPRPFYEVKVTFQGDSPFEATALVPKGCTPFVADEEKNVSEPKSFLKKEEASALLDRVYATMPKPWKVEEETKTGTENPPTLYSLTDLQKWANQNWGWEAKRTLDAAQAAYESDKTLSYPRTDACFLPKDSKDKMDAAYSSIRIGFLDSQVSVPSIVVEPSQAPRASYLFDDSKLTDHYAIVPTGVIPKDLNSDSGRIWLAVVRRFFIAFSQPAKTATLKRKMSFGEDVAVCSGKRYLDKGWIDVDDALCGLTGHSPKSSSEGLPGCGDSAPVIDARIHAGATTPPKPYTEATLLSIMENIHTKLERDEEELKDAIAQKGLGTPATRAAIIELLIDRKYIRREKKGGTTFLRATDTGHDLIGRLKKVKLSFLTEPDLTADWEQKLLDMESGKGMSRDNFLDEICKMVDSTISILKDHCGGVERSAPAIGKESSTLCPVSEKPVLDFESFWEFPGFSGCRFYKEVAKRKLSLEEMVSVLSGENKVLDGFVSKKGTKFSASLKFDPREKKLAFVFPEAPKKDTGDVASDGSPVKDCGSYWEISGANGRCWKTMAKREMKVSDYLAALEDGKSELLSGFVSTKSGNKFEAYIVPTREGFGFEFPQRDGGVRTPTSPKMTGPGASKKSSGGATTKSKKKY